MKNRRIYIGRAGRERGEVKETEKERWKGNEKESWKVKGRSEKGKKKDEEEEEEGPFLCHGWTKLVQLSLKCVQLYLNGSASPLLTSSLLLSSLLCLSYYSSENDDPNIFFIFTFNLV